MLFTFGGSIHDVPSDISFDASPVALLQVHSLGPAATVTVSTFPAPIAALPVRFVEVGPRITRWADHVRGTCPTKCRGTPMLARYALFHMHGAGVKACMTVGAQRHCVDQRGLNRIVPFNVTISSSDEMRLECYYKSMQKVPGMMRNDEMCFFHVLATSQVFQCWSDDVEWTCN